MELPEDELVVEFCVGNFGKLFDFACTGQQRFLWNDSMFANYRCSIDQIRSCSPPGVPKERLNNYWFLTFLPTRCAYGTRIKSVSILNFRMISAFSSHIMIIVNDCEYSALGGFCG